MSGTPESTQKKPQNRPPKPRGRAMMKRPRKSVKEDTIHPADYLKYVLPVNGPIGGFFCDVCSHYSRGQKLCTLGYKPIHTVQEQSARYEITGRIALCRFIEID